MKRYLCTLLSNTLNILPDNTLHNLLIETLSRRYQAKSSKDQLSFVLEFDKRLYTLEGQLATRYGNGVHTKHRHMNYHQFFIERIKANEKVLDIGCGYGALAYSIAEHAGADIDAIDINPNNINKAKETFSHEKITYLIGDALSYDFEKKYDIIVLSNVLEHLANRPQLLNTLVHATGAQKLLIRVPQFERDWRVPLKKEIGIDYRLDPTHETEFTKAQFYEEMAQADLTVAHFESIWGEFWTEIHTNQ